jgi:Flp pilus assembly protein TadG
MHRKTPTLGWDEGSVAVEAAVVFSLLFTLVFGIIEFGMALWQLNTMQLVVLQEGRHAMVNNGTITAVTAQNDMQNMLPGASVSCPLPNSPGAGTWHVCVVVDPAGTPPTMSLSANYGYTVLGLVGPFAVTAQSIVPLD